MELSKINKSLETLQNQLIALTAAGASLTEGKGWELRIERDRLEAERRKIIRGIR